MYEDSHTRMGKVHFLDPIDYISGERKKRSEMAASFLSTLRLVRLLIGLRCFIGHPAPSERGNRQPLRDPTF